VPSFILYNRAFQDPTIYNMMAKNGVRLEAWNVGKPVEHIYRDAVEWAAR
jgi:hypothetical protein